MTDRVNTLTVVLERPIRVDDVEYLIAAIRALRGVKDVAVGEVDHPGYGARLQESERWRRALFDLARNGPPEAP